MAVFNGREVETCDVGIDRAGDSVTWTVSYGVQIMRCIQ